MISAEGALIIVAVLVLAGLLAVVVLVLVRRPDHAPPEWMAEQARAADSAAARAAALAQAEADTMRRLDELRERLLELDRREQALQQREAGLADLEDDRRRELERVSRLSADEARAELVAGVHWLRNFSQSWRRHEAADLVAHHRFQIMREPRHRQNVRQLRRKPRIGVGRILVVQLRLVAPICTLKNAA